MAPNEHVFEGTLYLVPATPPGTVAHENADVTFEVLGLQAPTARGDAAISITGDREVPPDGPRGTCRYMHKVANEWVDDYKKKQHAEV